MCEQQEINVVHRLRNPPLFFRVLFCFLNLQVWARSKSTECGGHQIHTDDRRQISKKPLQLFQIPLEKYIRGIRTTVVSYDGDWRRCILKSFGLLSGQEGKGSISSSEIQFRVHL